MKRKLALILIFTLLIVSLAGCTSNSNTPEEPKEPTVSDQGSNELAKEEATGIDYPTKTIQIICVAKAGGATDAASRLVAQYLQEELDNPVVVVNMDGGGGSVASETVRNAKPDGYTLLFHHTQLQCNYHSGKYEYSYKDFFPIATMPHVSQTISVGADAPWNNLDELVEDVKNKPNEYTFGVQFGSVSQFIAGILMNETGIELNMVDSGGEAEKLTALQGGHLDIIQATVGAADQYVEAGKVKVLAVAADERDSLTPDFPTAKEQGYNISLPTMHAMYGPKDLPEDIAKKLNETFIKMEEDKDFIEKLNNVGQNYKYRDLEESAKYLEQEWNDIETIAIKLDMK